MVKIGLDCRVMEELPRFGDHGHKYVFPQCKRTEFEPVKASGSILKMPIIEFAVGQT